MSLNDRFTRWYDRQSIETLFLIGVSPMILCGVVLVVAAFIYG